MCSSVILVVVQRQAKLVSNTGSVGSRSTLHLKHDSKGSDMQADSKSADVFDILLDIFTS